MNTGIQNKQIKYRIIPEWGPDMVLYFFAYKFVFFSIQKS